MIAEHVEEFRIPAIPGSEKTARDRAGEFATGAGFVAGRIGDIKTAVSEAALNAIEHGVTGNASETVLIRLFRESDGVRITVSNRGRLFAIPIDKPDMKEKIEGRSRARGWGLYLIRELADRVSIEHEDGVTTISMKFSR